jgi:uncharacterized protein (TIGR00369 family)
VVPEPKDPNFLSKVEASFQRQRFMHTIGARLVSVNPGKCEIELAYREDLTQQHGYFHAGIVSTIADNAAGFAAFSLMPKGSSVVTVELKLNLLAPAVGESIIGRGQVLKSGRTLTVCRSEVYTLSGEEENLCAAALLTMMAVGDQKEAVADDTR